MDRYFVIATTVSLGAFGLPIPVPLSGVVAAAGVLAARGQFCVVLLTVVVTGAAILGDIIGYGTGRAGVHWYRRGGPQRLASPQRSTGVARQLVGNVLTWRTVTRVRRYAERRLVRGGRMGALIVLSHSLLGAFGPVINVLSGVRRYPLGRFLLYDAIGELLWTGAYVGLGFVAGMQGRDPRDLLMHPFMVIVLVVGFAGPVILTLRVGSREHPCPTVVAGSHLP